MNLLTIAIPTAVAAFALAKKANAADKMTIDIVDVKYKGIYNWEISFDAIMQSVNPTNTNLHVDYIYLEVYINPDTQNIKLATMQKTDAFTINAHQTTKYVIPVSVNLKTLALTYPVEIVQLIKSGMPDKIRLKGYVKSGNITVPYDETYEL